MSKTFRRNDEHTYRFADLRKAEKRARKAEKKAAKKNKAA